MERSFLKIILIFFLLPFFNIKTYSRDTVNNDSDSLSIIKYRWADSVYNSLTLDEKIAQLLVVRANYDKSYDRNELITELVEKYNIGGLTFFGGDPLTQAKLTNYWQGLSKTPLLISIDAEWGLGMRLSNAISFPYQMTLGAIQNDSLIFEMGCEIAKQCKRLGIQANFAPVIDINSNIANPVIGCRSFGEDKIRVAQKGIAYMNGLQQNGILATAKHFPGHGDTDSDSHYTLPIVSHSKERVDSLELYPFKKLIENGLGGIMVAHLYFPAYEKKKNTATTLSHNVVTKLLKEKLNFDGIVVTDALDMKGVTKYHRPGNIEVKAFQAGNDILLLPVDVPKAISKIKRAVAKGKISILDIDKRCRKILEYKEKLGLNKYQDVVIENIYEDINNSEAKYLNQKLYEEAITLVKNENSLIPLQKLDTLKVASVSIGCDVENGFQKMMNNYAKIDNFTMPKEPNDADIFSLLSKLSDYNLVIVGMHNTSIFPSRKFGIAQKSIDFIDSLKNQNKVILDLFASAYSLAYFEDTENIDAILVSYQDNEISMDVSAQIIFGGVGAKGKLPVTVSDEFPLNLGIETIPTRLKYTAPEELHISKTALEKIDSTANYGIEIGAYPGCQILAAKDGKVFYNKSFGYFTYDEKNAVENSDVYDLASITKIAATTIAMMKLVDDNVIDIDQKVSKYVPYLLNTNKEDIILRELMAHQARFQAWIPYFKSTILQSGPDPEIYKHNITEEFPIRVAENLYIKKYYIFNVFDSILISPLRDCDEYKYSDLGFYLLMQVLENTTNRPFELYLQDNFYNSLGLSKLGFFPRKNFELSDIVPTENDTVFRMQLLQGDVHDPGAAMLGGVCGHAGLFSNASDLAIIMQMLLQNGNYSGVNYIDSALVSEFTKIQFPLNDNRRGIGFDKPLQVCDEEGPTCEAVSDRSFGHSGFTGTYVWADPENNLIYVFLSNRVCPDASNWKIVDENIRTNIHKLFYEAVEN
ncbi:MAG: serine hydrolase [Bacteroidales bacterium]|nr:serine hydrolase [Bacteroidales bacterium]